MSYREREREREKRTRCAVGPRPSRTKMFAHAGSKTCRKFNQFLGPIVCFDRPTHCNHTSLLVCVSVHGDRFIIRLIMKSAP